MLLILSEASLCVWNIIIVIQIYQIYSTMEAKFNFNQNWLISYDAKNANRHCSVTAILRCNDMWYLKCVSTVFIFGGLSVYKREGERTRRLMKSLAPLYATAPLPLYIAQQQMFIFIFEFIFTFILASISILIQQPSSPYCAVGTSISIHIYIVLQQIYITFMQQPSSPYCAVDISVSIHILLCRSIGYSY